MDKYSGSAGGSGYKGSSGGGGSGAGASGSGTGFSGNKTGDKSHPSKKIILKGSDVVTMQGFRSSTRQEDMVKFATAGNKPVQTISWPMDHETKNHKNYMFVKYEDRRDAYKALKQDDQKKVDGKLIGIKKPNNK